MNFKYWFSEVITDFEMWELSSFSLERNGQLILKELLQRSNNEFVVDIGSVLIIPASCNYHRRSSFYFNSNLELFMVFFITKFFYLYLISFFFLFGVRILCNNMVEYIRINKIFFTYARSFIMVYSFPPHSIYFCGSMLIMSQWSSLAKWRILIFYSILNEEMIFERPCVLVASLLCRESKGRNL